MSRYDWGQTHPEIVRLEKAVGQARDLVVTHPLYANLTSHGAIGSLMEYHARFRLWDGILAAIKAGSGNA